ncbi:MAG: hypothetical protein ACTSYM_00450 [Candidatus Baldrarchaeia archaeon]
MASTIKRFRDISAGKEIFGPEESIAKILMNLLAPEDIEILKMTSDITAREVFALSLLDTIDKKREDYRVRIIPTFIENFLRLRASMWRKSRKEFLFFVAGIRELEAKKKKQTFDLYAGLR